MFVSQHNSYPPCKLTGRYYQAWLSCHPARLVCPPGRISTDIVYRGCLWFIRYGCLLRTSLLVIVLAVNVIMVLRWRRWKLAHVFCCYGCLSMDKLANGINSWALYSWVCVCLFTVLLTYISCVSTECAMFQSPRVFQWCGCCKKLLVASEYFFCSCVSIFPSYFERLSPVSETRCSFDCSCGMCLF